MKVVVNLDANTSDTFNLLKGEASIGAKQNNTRTIGDVK